MRSLFFICVSIGCLTSAAIAQDRVQIVASETLKFGVHRVGFSWHWKEELAKLEQGWERLRELPSEDSLDVKTRQRLLRRASRCSVTPSLSIRVERAELARPGQDLRVTASIESESSPTAVRLRYRHLTQFEDYQTVQMMRDPATGKYAGVIPGSFIVSEWDLIYFVEVLPQNGNGQLAPDLETEMPYVIVPVDRVTDAKSARVLSGAN